MARAIGITTGFNRSSRSKISALLAVILGVTGGIGLGLMIASPRAGVAFGATGSSVLALAMAINPLFAMLLWIVVMPFSGFTALDIPMDSIPDLTLMRTGVALLACIMLAKAAAGRIRLKWRFLDWLAALTVAGVGTSVLDSVDRNDAAALFLNSFLIPFAVYYVARCLVVGQRQMRAVMVTLLVISLYLSFIVILEQATGNVLFDPGPGYFRQYSVHVHRVVGLLGNPAFFGTILGMAAPFVLYLFTAEAAPRRKYLYLAALLVMLVAVVLTYVRASWIGLVAALVVCAITNPAARKMVLALGFCGALVVLFYWGIVEQSQVFQERVMSEGPIESRLVLYSTAGVMIADSPLRGVGFNNFNHFSKYFLTGWGDVPGSIGQVEVTPHNTFLWVLISSGILGFLPFLGLMVGVVTSPIRHALHWRKRSPNHWLLLGSLWGAWSAYVVNSMSIDVMFSSFTTLIFFFIAGSVLGTLDQASPGHVQREGRPHSE